MNFKIIPKLNPNQKLDRQIMPKLKGKVWFEKKKRRTCWGKMEKRGEREEFRGWGSSYFSIRVFVSM
jgi:hypothetical protein